MCTLFRFQKRMDKCEGADCCKEHLDGLNECWEEIQKLLKKKKHYHSYSHWHYAKTWSDWLSIGGTANCDSFPIEEVQFRGEWEENSLHFSSEMSWRRRSLSREERTCTLSRMDRSSDLVDPAYSNNRNKNYSDAQSHVLHYLNQIGWHDWRIGWVCERSGRETKERGERSDRGRGVRKRRRILWDTRFRLLFWCVTTWVDTQKTVRWEWEKSR